MRQIINRRQTTLLLAALREIPAAPVEERHRLQAAASPFLSWATGLPRDELSLLAQQRDSFPADLWEALGQEIGEDASFPETLLDAVALLLGLAEVDPEQSWEVLEEWAEVAELDEDQTFLSCLRFVGPPGARHPAVARRESLDALGLTDSVSADALDHAYRQKAKAHHPDRHNSKPTEEQQAQARLFKAVHNAYEALQIPAELWGSHPQEAELRPASAGTTVGCFFCEQHVTLHTSDWEATVLRCAGCDAILLHAYRDAQWLHSERALLAGSGYPSSQSDRSESEPSHPEQPNPHAIATNGPGPTTPPPRYEDASSHPPTDDAAPAAHEAHPTPPEQLEPEPVLDEEVDEVESAAYTGQESPAEPPLDPDFATSPPPDAASTTPPVRHAAAILGLAAIIVFAWFSVPRGHQNEEQAAEQAAASSRPADDAAARRAEPQRYDRSRSTSAPKGQTPPPAVASPTPARPTPPRPAAQANQLSTALAMARSRTRALPPAEAVATYKSLIENHKVAANRFPTDWMMVLEDQIAAYDRLLLQSSQRSPPDMATIRTAHERAQLCHNLMKWLHDKQNATVAASQRYEYAREQYLYVVESLLLLVQAGRLDRDVKLELGTVEENMGRLCLEWGERTNDSARVREAARWFQNAEDTYGMLGADGRSRAERVRGKQREQSQVLVRLTP